MGKAQVLPDLGRLQGKGRPGQGAGGKRPPPGVQGGIAKPSHGKHVKFGAKPEEEEGKAERQEAARKQNAWQGTLEARMHARMEACGDMSDLSEEESEEEGIRGSEEQEDGSQEEESGPSGSDDDDSGPEEMNRERSLQAQVADVPFEVLEALRQDGSGPSGRAARDAARAGEHAQQSFHRANRHRPSELSSKKQVARHRDIIQVPKRNGADPRFEANAAVGGGKSIVKAKAGGRPGSAAAERSYAFLYDDVIPKEKKELKERMKKEKNPKFKERMQGELTKLDQASKAEEARRKSAKLLAGARGMEKAAVLGGKMPYYPKKAELKRLELLAKYEELKKGNKLDKFMEKRRKKNASKDHRYVPGRREEE
ncbi:hypothetical protein FOA52_008053 [Chlamydomonas sp. UWO 241]|nr:hypothetical protein FOA52_008053 [Chlamydomonas sp. UWO 241]